MLLIDNTVCKVPIARINVDTPYLSGEVEAQSLPDKIYDLVIGNVLGARPAEDPDPALKEVCAITTRSHAKKEGKSTPRKVPKSKVSVIVNRETLIKMQKEDGSLKNYWDRQDITKREKEVSFEVKNGVLFRIYKHPT